MADPMEIAQKFGIPVFGAVAGWITAALKTAGRVTNLEKDIGDHKKAHADYKAEQEKKSDKYERELKEQFQNLGRAWKLELDSQKGEAEKDINELKTQLKELEDSFERFTRASHHDFADNEAFTRFVEEMNRQWKAVERTLGHIEGWMKAQSKSPSTFPPPMSTATKSSPRQR